MSIPPAIPELVASPKVTSLFGTTHRQVAQQQLLDKGEDGSVGADSQCEGEQRDRGKGRPFGKRAQADACVLEKIVDAQIPSVKTRPDA